jgi:ElaB/YqjD/DUF883 family membrane-anchored ribosome-binding protein
MGSSSAERVATDTGETVQSGIESMRRQGSRLADQASEQVSQAQDAVVEVFEDFEASVRRNPTAAVAIAAGVGLFLGLLLRR